MTLPGIGDPAGFGTACSSSTRQSQEQRPSVAEQWSAVLKDGGYEPPDIDRLSLPKVLRYTRTWRRLHRLLPIRPGFTFFEVGCGGGSQLMPLAYHGHSVAGIDYSKEVLARCREHKRRIELALGRSLPLTLFNGDFLEFRHEDKYDVVFNFGVIEHYLEEHERLLFLRRMAMLARPGGFVVSVVPNGIHPVRHQQRLEHLGGYNVPEVDYSASVGLFELDKVGLEAGRVIPANLFGYLDLEPSDSHVPRQIRRLAYLAAQIVPAWPSGWTFRHAYTLMIIGRRPTTRPIPSHSMRDEESG